MFDLLTLLPVEVWHYILFQTRILKSKDVRNLRSSSRYFRQIISLKDPYTVSYWRSLSGINKCLAVNDRLAISIVYKYDFNSLTPSSKKRALNWACRNNTSHLLKQILGYYRRHHHRCVTTDEFSIDNKFLIIACESGSWKVVKELLKITDPSAFKQKAIVLSCSRGHPKVVQLLLNDPRVDVNTADFNPLRRACIDGRVEVVKLLCEWYNTIDPSGNLLCEAMTSKDNLNIRRCGNSAEVTKFLLSLKCVDPTARKSEAFVEACREGSLDSVKAFVGDGRVDVNTKNSAPIRVAYEWKRKEIVEYLLGLTEIMSIIPRPNPIIISNNFFCTVCKKGDLEFAKRLVYVFQFDPATIHKDKLPLYEAAVRSRNYALTDFLLSFPQLDPTVHNYRVLIDSCKWGSTSIVKRLFTDPRVDLDSLPDDVANMCILNAVNCRRYKILKLLLTNPRFDPSFDNNALVHRAIQQGNIELIQILMSDERVNVTLSELELLTFPGEEHYNLSLGTYKYKDKYGDRWAHMIYRDVIYTIKACLQARHNKE